MKKIFFAAVLSCMMIFSAGCTQSNILDPEGGPQPDFSIVTDVELVWDQIDEDVAGFFRDLDDYSGLISFNYTHDDEEKMIKAQMFVDDTVTDKMAVRYAEDLLKYLNDSIAVQKNALSLSSDDSYGGFYDEYGYTIQVIPQDTKEDEETWLVNMTVQAGEDKKIVPCNSESN